VRAIGQKSGSTVPWINLVPGLGEHFDPISTGFWAVFQARSETGKSAPLDRFLIVH
jgi:hypothetical protein